MTESNERKTSSSSTIAEVVESDEVNVDILPPKIKGDDDRGDDSPLKIFVGTWNVGNKMPPKTSAGLNPWIPQGGDDYDVIAVGLQECKYTEKKSEEDKDVPDSPKRRLSPVKQNSKEKINEADEMRTRAKSPERFFRLERSPSSNTIENLRKRASVAIINTRNSFKDAMECQFLRQIYNHLGKEYFLAEKVELLEMRLAVFVHDRNFVSSVEKAYEATGVGSVIGNKGGLVLKLVVENTSLCFVSCHLAAHEGQKFLDKRNSDCSDIFKGARVGLKNIDLDCQFHHSFWLGDLNYRIDMNYTDKKDRSHIDHWNEVHGLVENEKWDILNKNDQLEHQIRNMYALTGWNNPSAQFPPTFKRLRQELRKYTEQRIPSYCDRVLWKSLPGFTDKINLIKYDCVEEILTSDHKPVIAVFDISPTPSISSPQSIGYTEVKITNLSGKNLLSMDLNGLSDPYIKFYADPAGTMVSSNGAPSTKIIMKTLSPVWGNNQIPKLKLAVKNAKDIKNIHLMMVLMDYDATSPDDEMGYGVISLGNYVNNNPQQFQTQLLLYGKPAGELCGTIEITLPSSNKFVRMNSSATKDRMIGCNCTVQ